LHTVLSVRPSILSSIYSILLVCLKSNNISLNEATDMAQNRPLWRLTSTSVAIGTPNGALPEKTKIQLLLLRTFND